MILNFGSLNIDRVYHVDHMLREGETQAAYDLSIFPGGKGLNQSIALARAGAEVWHAGAYGNGGDFLCELLKENGVHTEYLRKLDMPNGHTVIQVDRNGQNSILLFGGSNRSQSRTHIDSVLSHFGQGDWLVLQNEINELPYLIDAAYERGMRVILNPSPYDDMLQACDFSKVSLFLLNEVEAAQMIRAFRKSGRYAGQLQDSEETGSGTPADLAYMEKILPLAYPDAGFLLTLGSAGSEYIDAKQHIFQNIFKTEVVDTTAAGDTYTGYFLASLDQGRSIREAMCAASMASAIAVSKAGAAVSIPDRQEVQKHLS